MGVGKHVRRRFWMYGNAQDDEVARMATSSGGMAMDKRYKANCSWSGHHVSFLLVLWIVCTRYFTSIFA